MTQTALIIGGTGPTGPHIVEGMRQRGYRVSVLSRGVHSYPFPEDVERITGDPHFEEPLAAALGDRTFDVVIATYGRLKVTSKLLAGRTGHFLAVGGCAAYRGFTDPADVWPLGQLTPVPETAPLCGPGDHPFGGKIVAAENALFERHPDATLFRYPYVYGPRQIAPREWSLVRRVLDGRRTIVVTDGGMSLLSHHYAENAAHAILLAVDKPQAAAGKAYNCADDEQVTYRQLIEIGARVLGVELEIASIPDVPSAEGALIQHQPHHYLADTSLIKTDLGYRDLVPSVEAIARTMLWYRDNPLEYGGEYEQRRKDVFDYEAEDKLISLARAFKQAVSEVSLRERHANYTSHPYAHPKEHTGGRDERGR
ncbi:MAG: NAD-dependent epimerase/dehydratase family protein [Novosphingobium sp.]|nr:NAD-dependent epimerase/dehydratase family protein [Novosphingobium sp.]